MSLLRLLVLVAAAVAATAEGSCPGLMVKAKSSRRALVSGAPVKVAVTVKNTGSTTMAGVGVRLSSSVVGDWKTSAAKKAGTNMTVEGGLVLWSNYHLGPRKRLTFRARGRACAGLEAGEATLVEASVFQADTDDNVICETNISPLTVRATAFGIASRRVHRGGNRPPPSPHIVPPPTPDQVNIKTSKKANPKAPMCSAPVPPVPDVQCSLPSGITTGGVPVYMCKSVGYFCGANAYMGLGYTLQACADACQADATFNAAFTYVVESGYCDCFATSGASNISDDSVEYQSYAIGTPLDPPVTNGCP